MIVVIADDMTGAAEIGGIGLRYGLKTLLSSHAHIEDQPDLLVIYTNTRSMQQSGAVEQMKKLTADVMEMRPSLFYKKTDSVLRGHVLAELEVQMEVMGCTRALLVPANPNMGRFIKNGLYYVKDELLHESSFSKDPEFPVKTSSVKELVSAEKNSVAVRQPGSSLETGINIGETGTYEDVFAWTNYCSGDVLLAGGGCFFNALLERDYEEKKNTIAPGLQYPLLFVSGTAFDKGDAGWKDLRDTTSIMPDDMFYDHNSSDKAIVAWSEEIISILERSGRAFVAIGHNPEKGDPDRLREKLNQAVKRVLDKHPVRELIIEGGSTAFTIASGLDNGLLVPVEEWSHGVVRMKPEGKKGFLLTIKPGSYPWPAQWNFKNDQPAI
jgi:D-threonate/D-erythronate kinase